MNGEASANSPQPVRPSIQVTPQEEPPEHPGFEYVDPDSQDKELECPICTETCCDPVATKCSHYFCRPCLMRSNKLCPICKTPWNENELNTLEGLDYRIIRNMFARVLVKCLSCKIVTQRGLKGEVFQRHIDEDCVLQCRLGCSSPLTRKTWHSHDQVCPFVEIRCDAADIGCQTIVTRQKASHHQAVCLTYRMASIFREQQAQIVALRQELQTHTSHNTLPCEVFRHNYGSFSSNQYDNKFMDFTGCVGIVAISKRRIQYSCSITGHWVNDGEAYLKFRLRFTQQDPLNANFYVQNDKQTYYAPNENGTTKVVTKVVYNSRSTLEEFIMIGVIELNPGTYNVRLQIKMDRGDGTYPGYGWLSKYGDIVLVLA